MANHLLAELTPPTIANKVVKSFESIFVRFSLNPSLSVYIKALGQSSNITGMCKNTDPLLLSALSVEVFRHIGCSY